MGEEERKARKLGIPLILVGMGLIVLYFIAHQLLIEPNEPDHVEPAPVTEGR